MFMYILLKRVILFALKKYISNYIKGGHLNPAVTLGMSVAGRLSLRKLPIYWAAQTLGSFVASALCFAIYKGTNHLLIT